MPWKKGQSGNPNGRPITYEKSYLDALRIVGLEEVRPRSLSKFRRMAEIVWDKALAGEHWAIDHIANRLEGKPTEAIQPTPSSVKAEYRSYEEIREGLLEQGFDIEKLPLLSDLRRKRQEPEQ
jgi:Family of unknown function (DUF5681)